MVQAVAPTVLCRGSAVLDSASQGLAAASFAVERPPGPRPLGEARVVAVAALLPWSQTCPVPFRRGHVGTWGPGTYE